MQISKKILETPIAHLEYSVHDQKDNYPYSEKHIKTLTHYEVNLCLYFIYLAKLVNIVIDPIALIIKRMVGSKIYK